MKQDTEEAFLTDYDPTKYPPIAVSVDVVLFNLVDGVLKVLTVERSNHPYKGKTALPGSFLEQHDYPIDAAFRGVSTKANVFPSYVEQLGAYSDPLRDPRMRVISIAYWSIGPVTGVPAAGYHTSDARWIPVSGKADWAFDHERIVFDAWKRLADKMEYTSIALTFLPPTFTVSDLREVYEGIWGHDLDKGNFHRKVTKMVDFILPTGEKRGNAALYKGGRSVMVYPPMRREEGNW